MCGGGGGQAPRVKLVICTEGPPGLGKADPVRLGCTRLW